MLAQFEEERLSRLASGIVLALAPLLFQALCLMFIMGCQFDERFPYKRIEALAGQSLAFPRMSMKLLDLHSARFHVASLQLVPSCPCLVPIRARFVHAPNGQVRPAW